MASNAPGSMRTIDRWDGGIGWLADPDELMQRASHALVRDGEIWVVDPVDAPGVDDLLSSLGSVAGIVVLLDRHTRDAAALARRHGVHVHVPKGLPGMNGIDAPIEPFEDELASTGYRPRRVVDLPFWRETALIGHGTLVLADALGTASYFLTRRERLGVHPLLRLVPPRDGLAGVEPERILVGHGEGVLADAAETLSVALAGARRRAPRLYAETLLWGIGWISPRRRS